MMGSDILTTSQLAGAIDAANKRPEQVYVEGSCIIVNVAYEYIIELDRCDTYEKILGWVLQLSGKTWVDKDIIEKFVLLAMHTHHLAYPNI